MIKRALLIFLLFTSCFTGWSQEFSSRTFHKGWLVSDDYDTVRGSIKYDMEANAVQIIKSDEKVKTLSSKDILYFEIYDENLKSFRQFYSIPYAVTANYRVPILFEVLYEGPLTLLVRERIVMASDPYSQNYYNGPSPSKEMLDFTYYFVDKKGKMTLYNGKKAHLFEIMYKNADKVKSYIKTNKLKVDEMRDLVRISAFYNSL
jgi:hypothetical protein